MKYFLIYFQGTLQRALGEAEVTAFEDSSGGGTMLLEEYYVQRKIRMIDTAGFSVNDEGLLDECLAIMTGRWEFNNDSNFIDNNNNIDSSDYDNDNDNHHKNDTSNKNTSDSKNDVNDIQI